MAYLLFTQFLIMALVHVLMFPYSPLAYYAERKLGGYGRALAIITCSQVTLIVVTMFIMYYNYICCK